MKWEVGLCLPAAMISARDMQHMNMIKTAAVVAVLTVLGARSALAADAMACCCKDKEAKMACCEKMKGADAPKPNEQSSEAPAGQHQH